MSDQTEHSLKSGLVIMWSFMAMVLVFIVLYLSKVIPLEYWKSELSEVIWIPFHQGSALINYERNMFLLGIILFPSAILLFSKIPILNKFKLSRSLFVWIDLFATPILLASTITLLGWNDSFFIKYNWFYNWPILLTIVLLVSYFFRQIKFLNSNKFQNLADEGNRLFSYFFIFLFSLLFIGNEVILYSSNFIQHHFGVVLYGITEVVNGKTILVDFNHQYGMYPYFILPILKVIGSGVFQITLVMGFLSFLTFFFLYKGLLKLTGDHLFISLMGILSILYFNFSYTTYEMPSYHYLFQYLPIRTIFPSLIFYLFCLYSESRSERVLLIGSFCSAVSFFWNTETGLICSVAWVSSICFHLFSHREKGFKKYLKVILYVLASLILVAAVISIFTLLRAGSFPNWSNLFYFQKLFYLTGFMMLGLPSKHPWFLVMGVYAISLCYSLLSIQEKDNKYSSRIFFITILGVGLFSYFQGRSHHYNLILVWYPVIILVAAYLSRLGLVLKKTDLKLLSVTHIQYFVSLSLLVYGSLGFLSLVPKFTKLINSRFEAAKSKYHIEELVKSYRDRDKDEIDNKKTPIVLSFMDSAYIYSYLKTASPLPINDLNTFFTQADYLELVMGLEKNSEHPVLLKESFLHNKFGNSFRDINPIRRGLKIFLDKYYDDHGLLFADYKVYTPLKEKPRFKRREYKGQGKRKIDALQIENDFEIEMTVLPKSGQPASSTLLSNHFGGKRFHGVSFEQDKNIKNKYNFYIGNKRSWVLILRAKLEDNKENHLKIIKDGPIYRLFLNKKLIDFEINPTKIAWGSGPMIIGDWGKGGRKFKGLIKDFKLSFLYK